MQSLLVLDNGSVYTQDLVNFLTSININFENFSQDKFPHSKISEFDSFILSGRRQNNREMNALNSKIIKHCILNKKPLLGICYGAEILALTLGGTIRKMNLLRKGLHEVNVVKKNSLCSGTIKVFESHHYEISRLNNSLSMIGKSETCNNEIVQLNDHKIFGTQFHPEMSNDGKSILESFVSL